MKPHAFLLILILLAGFCFVGCGDNTDPVDGDDDNTVDGDDEQETEADTDGDEDGDVDGDEDGDLEEDGDEDGDLEEDTTDGEVWVGSKCGNKRDANEKDIEYKTDNDYVRFCEEGNVLDGAQVEFIKNNSLGNVLQDDVHVVISEDENDISIPGWKAVGPAVKFTATAIETDDVVKLRYDAKFRMPYNTDELPEFASDFYIYVAFKVDETNEIIPDTYDGKPELISKSVPAMQIERLPGLVNFKYNRFGTYQVVVPSETPETATRDFTFKGITGISMGCGGAVINAFRHPDKFDVIGPMGGLMDLRYLAANMHDVYTAGFCSMEEILADPDPAAVDAFVTNETGHCGAQLVNDEYPDGHPDGFPQNTSQEWSNPVYKWYTADKHEIYKRDEHSQGFNHWYYDSDGGGFDRNSYVHLFRDLAYAYGNPANYNPESPYFAAGLTGDPDDDTTRLGYYIKNVYKPNGNIKDEETGCYNLAKWMKAEPLTGLYDKKYNPDGTYPVINFCDGNYDRDGYETGDYEPHLNFKDYGADGIQNSREPGYNASTNPDPNGDNYDATTNPTGTEGNGTWDEFEPEQARSLRLDMSLAVDYNHNGIRDFGEPIIGQFYEPYEDCGTDGICNVDEPGYDASTNPDPNGDDYSPYTNPLGTEGNFLYEDGEPYEDLGLDGVACPTKGTCQYDYGEGNGKFDYNPNLAHMLEYDPILNLKKMSDEELLGLSIWMDGGIRDLFNFVIMGDNLYAALADRLNSLGVNTGTYDDFTDITTTLLEDPTKFGYFKVNYPLIGHASMMRYGSYDATDAMVRGGNGRHVDEGQMLKRVLTFYAYADSVFPGGDYSEVESYDAGRMGEMHSFYSEALGRQDKFTIALPPGYFTDNEDGGAGVPDICNSRYPVVYFGHGYGMGPEDMSATMLIMSTYMVAGSLQKMITVFTNGECYNKDLCYRDCELVCESQIASCESTCYETADCPNAEDSSACYSQCSDDCSQEAVTCTETCRGSEGRDCANVINECDKGNFYADHITTKEMPINENDGVKVEAGIHDLIDYIDTNYCTKKKQENVVVDAKSRLAIY